MASSRLAFSRQLGLPYETTADAAFPQGNNDIPKRTAHPYVTAPVMSQLPQRQPQAMVAKGSALRWLCACSPLLVKSKGVPESSDFRYASRPSHCNNLINSIVGGFFVVFFPPSMIVCTSYQKHLLLENTNIITDV